MNTTSLFYPPEYGYNIRCSSSCSSTGSSSSSTSSSSSSASYNSSPNSIITYDSGYIPNYQIIPQNPYIMKSPNPQKTFDVNYPEQYLEHFQLEQPPTDGFEKYFAPSAEPFPNINLSELYNDVNLDSVFYPPPMESQNWQQNPQHPSIQDQETQLNCNNKIISDETEKRVGRPRIYTAEQKRERKLHSAKKSREKKKSETKQLFERVNEMKMMVETLKCTEYQFQDCFNDLLRYTSQHLYQNKF